MDRTQESGMSVSDHDKKLLLVLGIGMCWVKSFVDLNIISHMETLTFCVYASYL